MHPAALRRSVVACLLSFSALPAFAQVPTSGLELWLRADQGVTAPGGAVEAWADGSGNGHVLSASGALRPALVPDVVNGLPVVRFDGTDQMNGNLGQTLGSATVFSLARFTVPSSDNDYLYAIGASGASGRQLTLARRNGDDPYHYDGSIENVATAELDAIAADTWYVFSQVYGGASPSSHVTYRSGVPVLATSATQPYAANAANFALGNWSSGSFRFVGDVAELLVYDRALSESEIAEVEDYLRDRAGLAPFPPDAHWDLTPWTTVQYEFGMQPDAQWVLKQAGTAVDQLVNCDGSILLGDFESRHTSIRGSIGSGSAPDFMGFVFGYQGRGTYYVFDWKKTTEAWCGQGEVGMRVRSIEIPAGADPTCADMWQAVDGPNVRTLVENDLAWASGVDYPFELHFRPGEFRVVVRQGAAVLEDWTVADATYTSGRFGFYVNSLQGVRFGAVTVNAYELGGGCATSGPVANLSAPPMFLGEDWQLSIAGAPPSTFLQVFFTGAPAFPLPLGGCTLHLDLTGALNPLPFGITDTHGSWGLPVPIPADPSLAGIDLAFQGALLTGAGPLGFDLTTGLLVSPQ